MRLLIPALVILGSVLFASVPVASAQGADGVYLSREESADVFGRLDEAKTLQKKVDTQEQEIAALKHIIELKDQIAELEAQKLAKQEQLTALAEKESDYWKARVEDVEKNARKSVRSAKMTGYAATGAAIGTFFPPFGPLIGGGIGAIVGFFAAP